MVMLLLWPDPPLGAAESVIDEAGLVPIVLAVCGTGVTCETVGETGTIGPPVYVMLPVVVLRVPPVAAGVVLLAGDCWMELLMQTILPIGTVLVLSRLGCDELKGRPQVPVALAKQYGVHVILSSGTPEAEDRKR